ncbi:hypothetical protein Anapl_06424 [Anas platyrhynchos]|uniref:Uncharacterized protein n=1 Tax=Anas platyrhynchos TaxID=8839 RepID=R0LYC8_ANAPL|nr:hypothetical protein Anapl_06424 [Anas platyrhynchos]
MLEGQLEISLLDPRKPLELHRSPSCRHRISAGVQAQPKLPKCNCQPYGAEGGPGPAGLCRAEDTKDKIGRKKPINRIFKAYSPLKYSQSLGPQSADVQEKPIVQEEDDKSKSSGGKTVSVWSLSACWSTGKLNTRSATITVTGKVENYSHMVEAASREMPGLLTTSNLKDKMTSLTAGRVTQDQCGQHETKPHSHCILKAKLEVALLNIPLNSLLPFTAKESNNSK